MSTPRNRSITVRETEKIMQIMCLGCRRLFRETTTPQVKSTINLAGAVRLQRTMSEPIPNKSLARKYVENCNKCKKKTWNIDGDIIYSKSINLKSLTKF